MPSCHGPAHASRPGAAIHARSSTHRIDIAHTTKERTPLPVRGRGCGFLGSQAENGGAARGVTRRPSAPIAARSSRMRTTDVRSPVDRSGHGRSISDWLHPSGGRGERSRRDGAAFTGGLQAAEGPTLHNGDYRAFVASATVQGHGVRRLPSGCYYQRRPRNCGDDGRSRRQPLRNSAIGGRKSRPASSTSSTKRARSTTASRGSRSASGAAESSKMR